MFKVSVVTFYKNHNNWRQIINIKSVNICDVFSSSNPLILNYVKYLKAMFTSIPFDCPVKLGRYYQYNVSVANPDLRVTEKGNAFFEMTTSLPNGVYRTNINFGTPEDPRGFLVQFTDRVEKRLNDENF
jgi:Protein of unknown function (DUF1091)